jgi:hypothetical protein
MPGKEPGVTETSDTIRGMVDVQAAHLPTGDRIAITVGCLAAAVAIAAVAFEHAYPDATTATWRLILFGSIAIAVAAVLYLIFDLAIRPRFGASLTRVWSKAPAIAASIFVIISFAGGLWYAAANTPTGEPTTTPPDVTATPTGVPTANPTQIISRADKFIFACDIPPPGHLSAEKAVKQKEEFKKELKTWGEVIGFALTVVDIDSGFKVIIEAETDEAKNRLISGGVIASVTKLTFEVRRIGLKLIVSIYAELPKEAIILSLIPVNPDAPQIVTGKKQIAQFLGGKDDACRLL